MKNLCQITVFQKIPFFCPNDFQSPCIFAAKIAPDFLNGTLILRCVMIYRTPHLSVYKVLEVESLEIVIGQLPKMM